MTRLAKIPVCIILLAALSGICSENRVYAVEVPAQQRVDNSSAAIDLAPGAIVISLKGGVCDTFQIFSITGQLVKTVSMAGPSKETVELPRGCYIVKCSQWSRKVVVK